MIILGIDPGASGAITILPIYSFKSVVVLPFKHNTLYDIFTYINQLPYQQEHTDQPYLSEVDGPRSDISITTKTGRIHYQRNIQMEMWLENPALVPGDGKISYRQMGERIGEWRGIAVGLNLVPQIVSPLKWQNAIRCRTKGNKNISKNKACRVFPFLANRGMITHDTADSLLIALYGYLQYVPRTKLPTSVRDNVPDISIKHKKVEMPKSKLRVFKQRTFRKPRPKKPSPIVR